MEVIDGGEDELGVKYETLCKINLSSGTGNQPPSQGDTQPASASLPDEIVRKQRRLRRLLQAPSRPAFNDSVRAAELVGLVLTGQSSDHSHEDRSPCLFSGILSVHDEIDAAVSRKTKTIEMLRRRVAEGMDSTKMVTVWREGVRHTVEVPDQAARHYWAQLSASLENLFPAKNSTSNDMLPHEAAQAARLERLPSIEDEVSQLSTTDRYLLSCLLRNLQQTKDIFREAAIRARLGKSVREFEEDVEREVNEQMKHVISDIPSHLPNHERKTDA
jgi:hypothetical protein